MRFTVEITRDDSGPGHTVTIEVRDAAPDGRGALLWRCTVAEESPRGALRRALAASKRWLVGWVGQDRERWW